MGEVLASGKQRGLRDAGNRKKTSGVCFSVVWDFRTLDSDCFLPEGLKKPTPPNCKEWRIFYRALRRWESSITFAVNHGCQISFFSPRGVTSVQVDCETFAAVLRFISGSGQVPPPFIYLSLHGQHRDWPNNEATAATAALTQSTLK